MISTITYLTTIEFGSGALTKLPEALVALKVIRPLIVSDKGVAAAGILAKATALLPKGPPEFLEVPTNPTEGAVDAAVAVYRSNGCDGVVAVGGGSPIDLAKGWRCA